MKTMAFPFRTVDRSTQPTRVEDGTRSVPTTLSRLEAAPTGGVLR